MTNQNAQGMWGLIRICMGWVFLWPFLDKLLGLGFSTAPENAWILGASPTTGFLKFGTGGPFAEIFQSLAGNPLVDWIFMLGLLGIGLALLFGIGVRIAGYSGALLLILMYLASAIPPEHNPFIDDHIIYALVLIALTFEASGTKFGFGKWWQKKKLVQRFPILR